VETQVTIFLAVVGFLFGSTIGSFLNVVIWRLPRGESLVLPGSHCPKCDTPIRWYDNIPLLSWLVLGAKCRHCREPISARYPAIELVNGLFFAAYLVRFGVSGDALVPFGVLIGTVWYLFTAALIAVTMIDIDHTIIPDAISLPGIVLGLLANMFLFAPTWQSGLIDGGLGVLLGGGIPLTIILVYYLLTKRIGMGFGDPKLLAMIGAFCGWQAVLFTLFIASLSGTIVGVAYVAIAGKDRRFPIPFGPFLSLGAVLWLWIGPLVVRWYLGF